ncbi:MAG: HYR domain-containing protein [Thaumarchaeota archaeon]|nr:HYR domain-containing protein [Nitrososphaerota archaeon]
MKKDYQKIVLITIVPILTIFLFTVGVVVSASGQIQNSITVSTDKSAYVEGETILITGEVRDLYSGTPVSVIVRHPDESTISLSQLTVGTDKKFSTEITAGGALMDIAGTYSVVAQYGNESRSAETTFFYKTAPTNISFTNPRVVDAWGNVLTNVKVNQQAQITANIFNNNNFSQDFFIYYITIRETGHEAWIWGSISPYQTFSPALSWIPTEAGTYTIDISLFDNIENKNKLAESLTTQIIVAEPEPLPPTIFISTNKVSYGNGDTVVISGNINNYDSSSNYAITYTVTSPENKRVGLGQIVPRSDGSFVDTFTAGGPLWVLSGNYVIEYRFGGILNEIIIIYTGGEPPLHGDPEPEPFPPTISISTNHSSFEQGDTIVVIGKVTNTENDVTLVVTTPSGNNVVALDQVSPDYFGNYSAFLKVGPTWEEEGSYTIEAKVTNEYSIASVKTTIYYTSGYVPDVGLEISADAVMGSTTIEITGTTDRLSEGITLTVTAPNGNIVSVAQAFTELDGRFATTIIIIPSLWYQDGYYTITAHRNDNPKYNASTEVYINDGRVNGAEPEPPTYPTYDTTPPKILKPTDITVDAENSNGARITFEVIAIDDTDQIVRPSCNPSSGSFFEIGETRIVCNARDSSGNRAIPISFNVTVNPLEIAIPDWIKTVASVWCDDKIANSEFISAIQYLIENNIISISETSSGYGSSQEIPSWVKNNACWWSQNLITGEDFASGIEYLVQQGIIRV